MFFIAGSQCDVIALVVRFTMAMICRFLDVVTRNAILSTNM